MEMNKYLINDIEKLAIINVLADIHSDITTLAYAYEYPKTRNGITLRDDGYLGACDDIRQKIRMRIQEL